MTAQKKLTVRILPELHKKLTELAKQKGISKNALIVQALWNLADTLSR